jgi:hypothetical protein
VDRVLSYMIHDATLGGLDARKPGPARPFIVDDLVSKGAVTGWLAAPLRV